MKKVDRFILLHWIPGQAKAKTGNEVNGSNNLHSKMLRLMCNTDKNILCDLGGLSPALNGTGSSNISLAYSLFRSFKLSLKRSILSGSSEFFVFLMYSKKNAIKIAIKKATMTERIQIWFLFGFTLLLRSGMMGGSII